MSKIVPVAIFFMFLVCISCKKEEIKKDLQKDNWTNPTLTYTYLATPIKQFPFDSSLTDQERIDSAGFIEFINKMNEAFSNSAFTSVEADSIYQMVYSSQIIRDEQIGMPSPNAVVIQPTLTELKKRLAIKKINENQFEIFFYHIGCGVNYVHYKVTYAPSGNLINMSNIFVIEWWSLSEPC